MLSEAKLLGVVDKLLTLDRADPSTHVGGHRRQASARPTLDRPSRLEVLVRRREKQVRVLLRQLVHDFGVFEVKEVGDPTPAHASKRRLGHPDLAQRLYGCNVVVCIQMTDCIAVPVDDLGQVTVGNATVSTETGGRGSRQLACPTEYIGSVRSKD